MKNTAAIVTYAIQARRFDDAASTEIPARSNFSFGLCKPLRPRPPTRSPEKKCMLAPADRVGNVPGHGPVRTGIAELSRWQREVGRVVSRAAAGGSESQRAYLCTTPETGGPEAPSPIRWKQE